MTTTDITSFDATGVAAFNIRGPTVRSALKLQVEDGHSHESATSKYKAHKGGASQDARQAWRKVRYLVVDEISMVSSTMLMYVSKRLKEITSKHEAFWGLSVIRVSDFYYLSGALCVP